jgi:hypothetical protein
MKKIPSKCDGQATPGGRWRAVHRGIVGTWDVARRTAPWATVGVAAGTLLSFVIRHLWPTLNVEPHVTAAARASLATALDRLGVLPPMLRLVRLRECGDMYRKLEADGLLTSEQRRREMEHLLKKYRL